MNLGHVKCVKFNTNFLTVLPCKPHDPDFVL